MSNLLKVGDIVTIDEQIERLHRPSPAPMPDCRKEYQLTDLDPVAD